MIGVIESSLALRGTSQPFVEIRMELFYPCVGSLNGCYIRESVFVLFFISVIDSSGGEYNAMDSSVEGSHYKQASGDLANGKLVKGERGPTCVCSLQTTESYVVAQAVSLVRGIGMP